MKSTVHLPKRYVLHTFHGSAVVVNEVSGRSRGDYLAVDVARLCGKAGIQS